VDDDPTILSTVSRLLGKEGHQVTAAVSRRLALERAREGRPDLAILDLQLADGSGLDLLGSLREMHPGLPVLIVSGYLPESVLSQALSLERVLLVQKPVETGRLLQAMGRLTASRAS
jgi:CheY-like chemotaxis protein